MSIRKVVKRVMSKSQVAKKARSGKDMGKRNNGSTAGFEAVEQAAMRRGMSPASAERIAGAQLQKMRRKGKL